MDVILKEDVDKIRQRWRVAHGEKASDPITEQAQVATLKGELDNLLAAPTVSEPVTESKPAEQAKASEPDDFAKLLAGLKI